MRHLISITNIEWKQATIQSVRKGFVERIAIPTELSVIIDVPRESDFDEYMKTTGKKIVESQFPGFEIANFIVKDREVLFHRREKVLAPRPIIAATFSVKQFLIDINRMKEVRENLKKQGNQNPFGFGEDDIKWEG